MEQILLFVKTIMIPAKTRVYSFQYVHKEDILIKEKYLKIEQN